VDTARTALGALCRGEREQFISHLTRDSKHLYGGLLEVTAPPFSCTECSPMVIATRPGKRRDLRRLTLSCGDELGEVMAVVEDGQWRLDLFLTEESLVMQPEMYEE